MRNEGEAMESGRPSEKELQLGIIVVKQEMFVTYRQTITVQDQENVPAALVFLQSKLSDGGVTGKAYVNMSQGGTNSIVTEEVGRIAIGSDLEREMDAVFRKAAHPKF